MNNTLDRKVRPDAAGEIDFEIPKIKKFKLENGLEVLFVKKDELPIIKFSLYSDSGSKLDPQGKKGLSNLFSRLIDEGAGEYNSLELTDEFDMLGTNFGIGCFPDDILLSLQTLTENLDRSLELFSLVLTKPHFDEKSFNREKNKILTTIQQLKDSPEDIATLAFDYRLFGNLNPYAYATIGYTNDLENISNNDIKEFYRNNFSPFISTLIVVGNIEPDKLKEKLNKYLSSWNNQAVMKDIPFNNTNESFSINFIHKKDAVQSEIRIGHLTAMRLDGNFFSRHILNTILGGQFTSRINLNLREDKGYTYGASSRFYYLKDAALFYISTSVGSENTGNAVKEILKELELIKKGVTQKELDFAKGSITKRFPASFETYNLISSNMHPIVLHSLPDDYFENFLKEINNKSIEDINKAALEYINPEKLTILVVGDKNLIKEQLENLNAGNITELDINGRVI